MFITNTESARMLRQTQTEALPFSETFPPGFTPGSQLSKNGRTVKSCLRKNRMVNINDEAHLVDGLEVGT